MDIPAAPEVDALNRAGYDLKKAGKYIPAKILFKRAIALDPRHPVLWENLAAALHDLNDLTGAQEATLKAEEMAAALSSHPLGDDLLNATIVDWCGDVAVETRGYQVSPHNKALLKAAFGDYGASKDLLRRILDANPNDARALWNLSQIQLAHGDWEDGLKNYEARFDFLGPDYFPRLPAPMWDGKADLNGKTLFIQPEQGAGDCILFSRFIPLLKQRYPQVQIVSTSPQNLTQLMWCFRDLMEILPFGVPWPSTDYATYLLSLPYFLGARPDNVPSDPGRFKARVDPYKNAIELPTPHVQPSLKVGICWTGNPIQAQNPHRSVPLEMFLELAENPHVQLYGLQPGSDEIQTKSASQIVCDLGDDLRKHGYIGTAAIMQHLDLVITICTSVAHLAGAVGVPCWTLLCKDAYWVWLKDRSDSIWYPNTKLFRQETPGDWRPVIEQVKHGLAALVENLLEK